MRQKITGHRTLYNRFIRWSRLGVFDRIRQILSSRRSNDKWGGTIVQIHVFPFGGLDRAAAWLRKRGSW